jgi:hypothetical protein
VTGEEGNYIMDSEKLNFGLGFYFMKAGKGINFADFDPKLLDVKVEQEIQEGFKLRPGKSIPFFPCADLIGKYEA